MVHCPALPSLARRSPGKRHVICLFHDPARPAGPTIILNSIVSMTSRKLNSDLERLREEINHLAADDIDSRKRLNRLISELEAKLENPDAGEDDGLMNNLKDAIAHFETEHPRATAILNDIMVTLSNMGI